MDGTASGRRGSGIATDQLLATASSVALLDAVDALHVWGAENDSEDVESWARRQHTVDQQYAQLTLDPYREDVEEPVDVAISPVPAELPDRTRPAMKNAIGNLLAIPMSWLLAVPIVLLDRLLSSGTEELLDWGE